MEETVILLESFRSKSELIMNWQFKGKGKEKEWIALYIYINEIVSTLSEINYYMRTKKSDIFSLVETKLNDFENVLVKEGQYTV